LLDIVRKFLPQMETIMSVQPRILVVDDVEDNREILRARLESQGYIVDTAENGEAALAAVAANPPDLILLDVMMPGLDGIETVKLLKADTSLPFIPVILLTAKTDSKDVVAGLEAGADEYLTKPFDHGALQARVKAMLRIKTLQDKVSHQACELAAWNKYLEQRVSAQVTEIERMSRLKRFLAPQIAEVIASETGDAALMSHRREITVVFCDLRGFTAFAETSEPEDIMDVLRAYHDAVGERIFFHEGTLERFAGDGIMVFFNDPVPCADHFARAIRLGIDIRDRVSVLCDQWERRGFKLGIGVGIAAGYATLGLIGFDKRFDYAAIGTVTNLAARLCSEAQAGQILLSQRVATAVEGVAASRLLAERALKGLHAPVAVYELAVRRIRCKS
jgi:class 3 adenylate cyclase/CheY-like chemotaxis protein